MSVGVGADRPDFLFRAGLLCLDLVNTEPAVGDQRVDLVPDAGALSRWLRLSAAAPMAGGSRAAQRWEDGPQAGEILREALRLRRELRGAAERMTQRGPVGPRLVAVVNRILATQPSYPRLVREGDGYVTRLRVRPTSALHVLAPVAQSAAWLLEHGDHSLVRRCEGPRCVLFFYDQTRNGRRRWCSMAACGSRSKSLAYYRRTRGGG